MSVDELARLRTSERDAGPARLLDLGGQHHVAGRLRGPVDALVGESSSW
jgi:hypothetical protein